MPQMKPSTRLKSGNYAVLDIGSAKVVCFIAQVDTSGHMRVIGVGHQLSKGIRSGIITNFSEAETSIIAAVHAAEKMAGVTIENVLVNVNGQGLQSCSQVIELSLMGQTVTDQDLIDIIGQGRMEEGATSTTDALKTVHCWPIDYTLDDAKNIHDPRQMHGDELSCNLHLIQMRANALKNLTQCMAYSHLNINEYVASPHASALACLDADEMELGVTLVDIGGGVTSIAMFHGGKNIYVNAVPLGGMHVTSDLAKGLLTTLAQAERLKTMHGSCIATPSDDQAMINVPLLGEDDEESKVIPRSVLVGIIRPRMEEIIEMVMDKMRASGLEKYYGRRIVITGGGCQLLGLREMAGRMMNKQIRIAKPRPIPGLAEAVSGPAFSGAIGMLQYLYYKPLEERLLEAAMEKKSFSAKWKNVLQWVKESF